MEKSVLEKYVSEGLSTRDISREENVSQTNVRYWLNKFGLKTDVKKSSKYHKYLCNSCGNTEPSNFYGNQKSRCKACENKKTTKIQINRKKEMVAYKGGKCERCGYVGPYVAYDFHHKDPSKKDPLARNMRVWKWDRALEELEKCELLCAICHRIEHSKYYSE